MRVLYIANRHSPANIDAGSGIDYFFRWALQQGEEWQVRVCGPFFRDAAMPERLVRRAYRAVTKKRYAKFPLSTVHWFANRIETEIRRWQPQVLFTPYPALLTFLNSKIPVVLRLDTTFVGQQTYQGEFGRVGMAISVWQERRVFSRSDAILTPSEWSRDILEERYSVPAGKTVVLTNPPMIPPEAIPPQIDVQREKQPSEPLRLLFVGKVAKRKGLDVAKKIVYELRRRGLNTHLTAVGIDSESSQQMNCVGLLRKGDPEQLVRYSQFFRSAHFLIHPARFEAAGIVPSEAAAFGTPTITCDVGGLATTVKDGESGVVLPSDSSPESYADAIEVLRPGSDRYIDLCTRTRQRYENELCWEGVAAKVRHVVECAARRNRP